MPHLIREIQKPVVLTLHQVFLSFSVNARNKVNAVKIIHN